MNHFHQQYYYQQQQQQQQQPNSLLSSVNQAILNHQQLQTQQQFQYQQQLQQYQYQQQQQYQYQQQQQLQYQQYQYPAVGLPTTSQGHSFSPTAYPTQPYNTTPCPPQPHPNFNNRQSQQRDQTKSNHHQNRRPKTSHSHHDKFRCEECKQEYYNLMDLSVHLRNHVKCDYENCKFEAIQDVLDLHKEDRHLIFKPGRSPQSKSKSNPKPDGPLNATIQGLGYALKTQEQVDNWIKERQKKWPTKAVIAQKRAEAEEKKKKILLEVANNYKNNHQNRRHVWVRNDQTDQPRRSVTTQRANSEPREPNSLQGEDTKQDGNDGSSSGSDIDPVKDSVPSKVPPPAPAPLANQSSSSSNPGRRKDNQTPRRPDQLNHQHSKQTGKGFSSNRRPGNSTSSHLFLDKSGLFSKVRNLFPSRKENKHVFILSS